MSSSVADSSCMAGLISWTKVFVALLSILRWRFLGEFSGLNRTCRAQFALRVVGDCGLSCKTGRQLCQLW